jgi:hypothetical protein
MVKLKPDPIQKSDLIEYLDSYSDFSFELSVLKMLRANGLECEHGGLYEDPVTGKSREFDIRAIKTIHNYRVRLAVECKNIRENFPVLISCIPRHKYESYHQIALLSEPNTSGLFTIPNQFRVRAKILSIRGKYSIYKPHEVVGKSTVQVGITSEKVISANDNNLHDKWSQCLSSTTDLVLRTYWDGDKEEGSFYFSLVIPIVVIPNDRLWIVKYDDDGNRVSEPNQTDRCSCFIDKYYGMGTKLSATKYYGMGTKLSATRIRISHMEIMTIDGLKFFANSHLKSEIGISKLFSTEGISKALNHEGKE